MRSLYLLWLVPSLAFAQVDTRVTDTVQSRGNPQQVEREQPPRRMDPAPRTDRPQTFNRPLPPLPMDRQWISQRPTWDDCLIVPFQLRSACMDRATMRSQPMNNRPNRFRQQMRRATPQQRRQIQQARKEFQQKVQRILRSR